MITPELIKQAIQETRDFGEAKCVRLRRIARPVRIYADDGRKTVPLHGAYKNCDGDWEEEVFDADEFIPAPRQKTVRVYWDKEGKDYAVTQPNEKPPQSLKDKARACALVTLTEGEFE